MSFTKENYSIIHYLVETNVLTVNFVKTNVLTVNTLVKTLNRNKDDILQTTKGKKFFSLHVGTP